MMNETTSDDTVPTAAQPPATGASDPTGSDLTGSTGTGGTGTGSTGTGVDALTVSADAAIPARPARSSRRRVGLLALVAIVVLLLDQASKTVALDRLTENVRVPFLGDLLGWRLVFNPGAALSFGTGVTWIFTIAMAACSIAVILLATRIRSRGWAVAAGGLLGGALGNLVDRLARDPGFAVGHVVDFIDYGVFIGNVADIGIVAAAAGFVLLTLLGISWDGTRERGGRSGSSEHPVAARAVEGDGTPDDGAGGRP